MRSQFEGLAIKERVWTQVAKNLAQVKVADTQLFTVHCVLAGVKAEAHGPEWKTQRHRAANMAAFGHQRAAGNGRRGLDYMIKPGHTPEQHIEAALQLPNPFSIPPDSDEDLKFAARSVAILGNVLPVFRQMQLALLLTVLTAIAPLAEALWALQTPEIARIAAAKNAALIAFWTVVLIWPDRSQARAFIEGFHIVGDFESTSLFRQLPTKTDPPDKNDFYGPTAQKAVSDLQSSREHKNAEAIWRLTLEDVEKGFAEGPFHIPRS